MGIFDRLMYVPFGDFVILTLIFGALGFGVGWTVNQLRQPPPPR